MKILTISDEVCPALYDFYTPGKLDDYDLIISCGDLKPSYLSFLVTMTRVPLLYVHGNHDTRYEKNPPEGCDCIEDKLVVYRGLRILGLGGSPVYNGGAHQYTESQMRWRIFKLKRKIRKHGGVDVVVSHAPLAGVGDGDDFAHRGFHEFLRFVDKYHPKYWLHGHVHLNYGIDRTRVREYNGTKVINTCERYVLEIPQHEIPATGKKGDIDYKMYQSKS
ncbi:MAG: metallophosphoesterase [Oscillospiraceae bacterium]|nr:metallophosphoesterase [Oscillospiraceae bacterium]